MAAELSSRSCWSVRPRERDAVRELRDVLGDEPGALVLLYAWPDYKPAALTDAIREHFRHATVAACTTAGQVLDGHGYVEGGITGLSLASPRLSATRLDIPDVTAVDCRSLRELAARVGETDSADAVGPDAQCFGLLLIDGLCGREEHVASSLQMAMREIPIVGGSAGDAGRFEQTCVWTDAGWRAGAATLVIVRTTLPFQTFYAHPFDSRLERMVVTEADASRRIVSRIDGQPAADVYAGAIGLSRAELTPAAWAHRPLVLKAGDRLYVRSIRSCLDDGALLLYSAVEQGTVLRIGRPRDPMVNLSTCITGLRRDVPNLHTILGFDCILRRQDFCSSERLAEAGRTIRGSGLFAFSTYGEQHNGLHFNQTLTGVAIGDR